MARDRDAGTSPEVAQHLTLEVVAGDITTIDADIAAFKYAQGLYGADAAARRLLSEAGVDFQQSSLAPGKHFLVNTRGALGARHALFVGTPRLRDIGYSDIRVFGAAVVRAVAASAPQCRHLAITIHGPGVGLDEVESLLSLLTGCLEQIALQSATALTRISVVERSTARVERLRHALQIPPRLGPGVTVLTSATGWLVRLDGATSLVKAQPTDFAELPGDASSKKSPIFVAMPFADEFSDLFEYGIQDPIRRLGYVCERVDRVAFAGDVLQRIKSKIAEASVVVGVLTGASPDVYLEIGYAWGKEKPTILAIKKGESLRFDIQGQRLLVYETIKDLESKLTAEIEGLRKEAVM